ncbi:sigma factor-like helix-turn-helix DNA-binding protein [Nonomuraea wenchangensis]
MAWTIDGYTPAEIAELLDKSPPTVRVNLFKGRATLRIALAGKGRRSSRRWTSRRAYGRSPSRGRPCSWSRTTAPCRRPSPGS